MDTEDIVTSEDKTEEKDFNDVTDVNILNKYKLAGEIANATVQRIIAAAAPGVSVLDLCVAGDAFIQESASKVHNKKEKGQSVSKGLAFPTSISVNNIVCHFAPLKGDATTLKAGDLVKVDVGVHIDGYPVTLGHTFVVDAQSMGKAVNSNRPVFDGRKADVVAAAYTAVQCALRLTKPGVKLIDIKDTISQAAKEFNCNAVLGIPVHEVARGQLISERDALGLLELKSDPEAIVDAHKVYYIDVLLSTGSGKPSIVADRGTIFQRSKTSTYMLKRKSSRAFYNEIAKNFPTFPFCTRQFDDPQSRMGLVECVTHGLFQQYPVIQDKNGEFVAQFKFTAVVMPNGTHVLTGLPTDTSKVNTQHKLANPALSAILAGALPSAGSKKKKNKKKKNKKSAPQQQQQQSAQQGAEEDDDDEEEEDTAMEQ